MPGISILNEEYWKILNSSSEISESFIIMKLLTSLFWQENIPKRRNKIVEIVICLIVWFLAYNVLQIWPVAVHLHFVSWLLVCLFFLSFVLIALKRLWAIICCYVLAFIYSIFSYFNFSVTNSWYFLYLKSNLFGLYFEVSIPF